MRIIKGKINFQLALHSFFAQSKRVGGSQVLVEKVHSSWYETPVISPLLNYFFVLLLYKKKIHGAFQENRGEKEHKHLVKVCGRFSTEIFCCCGTATQPNILFPTSMELCRLRSYFYFSRYLTPCSLDSSRKQGVHALHKIPDAAGMWNKIFSHYTRGNYLCQFHTHPDKYNIYFIFCHYRDFTLDIW